MSKGLFDLHSSFVEGIKKVFQIASYIVLIGSLIDLYKYSTNTKIVYLNTINIAVIIIILILFYFKKLNYKICFTILIYSILANIFIGKLISDIDAEDPVKAYLFLRDSIFVILLLSLAAFALHKIHALIIGFIYLHVLILFDIFIRTEFIHQNIPIIITTFSAYVGLTYYLVSMFEKALIGQQEKNQFIEHKNIELNDANRLLKERQVMIEEQSKHIVYQSEELKVKNEELGRLNTSKDLFLSIIAHDLKNPFNVIKGYAEILRARFSSLDEPRKLQYIESIENSSKTTYNLLENLLSWARAQNNMVDIKPEYIFLNPLILEVILLFKDAMAEKKISLHFSPDKSLKAYADSDMISTVIRNLISNAIKFTFPGGNISVILREIENDIEIVIADDGIGISQDELNKIFKIDKHTSTSGTVGEAGSGLGLILCKLFVEKNNGRLQVISERKIGTQFSVILPKFNKEEKLLN